MTTALMRLLNTHSHTAGLAIQIRIQPNFTYYIGLDSVTFLFCFRS